MSVPSIPALTVADAGFLAPTWQTGVANANPADFGQILADGLSRVETRNAAANDLATQFAVDDSIPPHQVIIAMEEARMSMGLILQVRSRVVQAVSQLMQMQI